MNKLKTLFAVGLLASASSIVHAAPDPAKSHGADAAKTQGPVTESRSNVLNPMREKEPMPGEMKRDGMMKEDVRNQAMKKDAMMRDAMKNEEMKK